MNTTEMVQIALDLAQLQELPLDSSVSVPGENITRVLAGIDMGAAELTLARQLGYDCVARDHNMVPRLGKLGELVAQSHYEKLVHYGVPVNVAQKLLEHRKRATEIMFHGSNLDGGPSVARLLGMPYLGLHTPADLLGERMVEAKVDEVYEANDNPTVQEILDNLMTIREYAQAPAPCHLGGRKGQLRRKDCGGFCRRPGGGAGRAEGADHRRCGYLCLHAHGR